MNLRSIFGFTAAATLALMAWHSASAETAKQKPITITEAWSRATVPAASVGVAYFTVTNSGAADRLLRVESPVAARAEVHSSSVRNGTAQMRPVESVSVPANGQVRLEPGGLHVMLIDLRQPLRAGETFPLTLVFQEAGSVTTQVKVQPLGATDAHAH